ncbi:MAG: tripartite tricarboxylate transporter substrate binding protein [Betaproteobacteria bacterium]|nr:tripartite tricarboxylate transporter substrate binding protein [Betaproteobacteria bacterium]
MRFGIRFIARAWLFSLAVCSVALALPSAARAQDYPSKPIKIIVPNPPGGGNDFVGRLVAERFREKWKQSVIVENRAGASGSIGAEAVARSAPDGYTLLVTPPASLVINKSFYAKLAYDPDAFVPVSVIVAGPGVLLLNPQVAAESLPQLIAFGKANPGKLTYASQGNGTIAHLAGELFQSMGGVKSVHVPYKGSGPAMAGLLGGQVNMMFGELAPALPHIRAGKLRVLAVGSEKRNPMLPDTPTMSEMLPGFAFSYWIAMVAPAGTPSAIANKLSAAIAELKQPEAAKRLLDTSLDAIGNTPAEMALFLRQESERWGNVIRVTGMKAQ